MRRTAFLCFIALLGTPSLAAEGHFDLAPAPIKGSTILDIANNAEMKELDEVLSGVGANLWMRLFQIAEEGGCVPETHAVCSFRYYLAVREDGELPALALFYLGDVGEIEKITAFDAGGPDSVILQFTVTNYPRDVLRRLPELKRQARIYRAKIEKVEGNGGGTYKLRMQ